MRKYYRHRSAPNTLYPYKMTDGEAVCEFMDSAFYQPHWRLSDHYLHQYREISKLQFLIETGLEADSLPTAIWSSDGSQAVDEG